MFLRMDVSERPDSTTSADLPISTDDFRTHRTRVASNRTCGGATVIGDQNVCFVTREGAESNFMIFFFFCSVVWL